MVFPDDEGGLGLDIVTLPVGVTTLTGQWRLGKRVCFVGSSEEPAFPQCPHVWTDSELRWSRCSRVEGHEGVHI